jgi:hypothetical protein
MRLPQRITVVLMFLLLPQLISGQGKALELLLADSSMVSSSASVCILDMGKGEAVFEYNAGKSLIPASVMNL